MLAEPDELYNGGQAFKICARDARGVIVTVIADNYFGYCKKEVKTQISYTANLFGNVEEEHAGGALVLPSYNLGQEYADNRAEDDAVLDVLARDPQRFDLQPEGHAIDRELDGVVLVPAGARTRCRICGSLGDGDGERSHPAARRRPTSRPTATGSRWPRTVRTARRGPDRHVPGRDVLPQAGTVSGGGKSEISKALADAIIFGNDHVADFDADMDSVEEILARDYSDGSPTPSAPATPARSCPPSDRSAA